MALLLLRAIMKEDRASLMTNEVESVVFKETIVVLARPVDAMAICIGVPCRYLTQSRHEQERRTVP